MTSGKIKTYILLSILSVLAVVNVSCVEEEVYYFNDPIWGSWILAYDNYGPVSPDYAEVYYFGSDGYGYLDWYDEWGTRYVDDFSWTVNGDHLDIFYVDGSYEYYNYYFRNGNLVLDDGYNYFEYRRY